MAQRLYIMPISGTGASAADARQPKYAALADGPWSMIDGGGICLLGADISDAANTAILANVDVIALPITALISAALALSINSFLAARGISFRVTAGQPSVAEASGLAEAVQPGLLGQPLQLNNLRLR